MLTVGRKIDYDEFYSQIDQNWWTYKEYITEDKDSYIRKLKQDGSSTGEAELHALSVLYNVKIEVYKGKNSSLID